MLLHLPGVLFLNLEANSYHIHIIQVKTYTGQLDKEDEEADVGLPGVQRPRGRLVPGHL